MSYAEPGYSFPWEREAMKGAEMPDGLSMYDQMAYISLRTLYHDYHERRLDRATASAEKRRIALARDRSKHTADYENRLAVFRARVCKDTEKAKTMVRKDPSPENAMRLCDVLDGLKRMETCDEACRITADALRGRQSPARPDRSRWEGCGQCRPSGQLELDADCEYSYCPYCGRPLTEEAWADLERRINGGTSYKAK